MIICLAQLVITLLPSYNKIAEKALVGLQIGTLTVSSILVNVLVHLRLELADFGVLITMITRCVITFTLMSLISAGQPGFENNDIKQLQDSIIFIYFTAFTLVSINWKLDLLVTTPFVAVSQYLATIWAFSTSNGNMDCYSAAADSFGSHQASRWMTMLLGLVVHKYVSFYNELNEFVERENSFAQQKSLKNILDH